MKDNYQAEPEGASENIEDVKKELAELKAIIRDIRLVLKNLIIVERGGCEEENLTFKQYQEKRNAIRNRLRKMILETE